MTPTMEATYQALKGMDKNFDEARAHLRIMQEVGHPNAVKMAADLDKAERSRGDLMKAIEKEANR
jgi:hypothetical protein